MKSEKINELAAALCIAQKALSPAKKDAKNPHLKNSYATLDSVIAAAKGALADNGLSFSQLIDNDGAGGLVLETLLMHKSGQWLSSSTPVEQLQGNRGVNSLQSLGASLTYYKRYALSAILGISVADEDTIGEAPQGKRQQQQPQSKEPHTFNSPDEAIKWGFDQGLFTHEQHAKNAYEKVKAEYQPKTAAEMAALWIAEIGKRAEVATNGEA